MNTRILGFRIAGTIFGIIAWFFLLPFFIYPSSFLRPSSDLPPTCLRLASDLPLSFLYLSFVFPSLILHVPSKVSTHHPPFTHTQFPMANPNP